ncbi:MULTISPECIES: hypothetical protein [Cellulosimicrobium]|uniref:Uncharacterized protein n=1 Tax=Cellulosimicrobium sp. ES-005 TaxID=3163031 RepID=A0AAU8G2C1_9MICO|nr:hypothetical protein [Cellulosimicrobium cellulans]MCO7274802.1 hypothetical protein [Cellulosimicrobium cellulans]
MKKFLSSALVAGLLATGAVALTAPAASAAVVGCSVSGPSVSGTTARVTNINCTYARVVVKYVSNGTVRTSYGAWVAAGHTSTAYVPSISAIVSLSADGSR